MPVVSLSEGKQLFNASLNTLSMAAFSFPGGAPVGVALMVFMGLFDAILGDPPAAPSQDITRTELKDAVDAVKAQIIDAIWKGTEDDITDQVLALQQGFLDLHAAMSKLKMDGERYIVSITNVTVSNFIDRTDDYFEVTQQQSPGGMIDILRRSRYFLEIRAAKVSDAQAIQHQTHTLGLYALVASLNVAYLKTAVAWRWGRELLGAWQHQQYTVQLAVWNKMTLQDRAKYPNQDPVKMYAGVKTDPNYKPPTWEEWTTDPNPSPPPATVPDMNCPANLLIQAVDDMLSYCVLTSAQKPGIYPAILSNLTDLDNKVSVGNAGLGFGAAVTKAQMKNAVESGAKAAGWLQVQEPSLGFDTVTEADVLDFGKTIDSWRAAKASVCFTTHPVTAGETLTSIAKGAYPGQDAAAFAQKLYNFNPGIKFTGQPTGGDWTGAAIAPDTIVKIFNKEVFADLA